MLAPQGHARAALLVKGWIYRKSSSGATEKGKRKSKEG